MGRGYSQILALGASIAGIALAGTLPHRPRAILPPFSPEYVVSSLF